jgi:hypothetical protein
MGKVKATMLPSLAMRRFRVVLPRIPFELSLTDREAQVVDDVTDAARVARETGLGEKIADVARTFADGVRQLSASRNARRRR